MSHYKPFNIKDRNEMGARSSVFLARYAGRLVLLRDLWTLWVAQYLIPTTPTASAFEGSVLPSGLTLPHSHYARPLVFLRDLWTLRVAQYLIHLHIRR